MKIVYVFFAFLVLNHAAFAASFDCNKASTSVEKQICGDTLLSRLDDALAENYQNMVASDIGCRAQVFHQA
jgi:uncharacterized protein